MTATTGPGIADGPQGQSRTETNDRAAHVEWRLEVTVPGIPVPKGSYRAFIPRGWVERGIRRAVVTNDNQKTKPWEAAIASEVFMVRGHQAPIEEPVVLEVRFYFPRPKSAKKSVFVPCVAKNDIDKLLRAIMDGLKAGGAFRDDGQVTDIDHMKKRFAGGWGDPEGERGLPRATIKVGRIV